MLLLINNLIQSSFHLIEPKPTDNLVYSRWLVPSHLSDSHPLIPWTLLFQNVLFCWCPRGFYNLKLCTTVKFETHEKYSLFWKMGGNLDQRQINFKKGKYENWDLETDRLKTIAAPLSLRKKILYSGIFLSQF